MGEIRCLDLGVFCCVVGGLLCVFWGVCFCVPNSQNQSSDASSRIPLRKITFLGVHKRRATNEGNIRQRRGNFIMEREKANPVMGKKKGFRSENFSRTGVI